MGLLTLNLPMGTPWESHGIKCLFTSRWVRPVKWCYSQPAELRFGSRRIMASSGVQQGDPLGPLLFF